MNTIDLKKDITTIVNKIDDESVLLAIKYFIHKQNTDFWDELPEHVKESINMGIEQAEKGMLIPNSEVMQNIKSKYL